MTRFWLERDVDGFQLDIAHFYMGNPQLRNNPPRFHPRPIKEYQLQGPIYNRSRPGEPCLVQACMYTSPQVPFGNSQTRQFLDILQKRGKDD